MPKKAHSPAATATAKPVGGEPAEVTIDPARKTSKLEQVIALLVSDTGTTLVAMAELTGWHAHTVRAALSGLKKRGYVINSDKLDGVRTYRASAPE